MSEVRNKEENNSWISSLVATKL